MDITDISSLIISLVTTFGGAVLVIITATVGLGVAYLAFRFGWKKVKNSVGVFPPTKFRDAMERDAFRRGMQLNKKDGVDLS